MLADTSRWAPRFVAFLLAGGMLLAYALRGGGSYDLVAFEEAGLVVWLVLGIGVAAGVLPRSRPSRPQLALLLALLTYAAWTALSLLWTSSSERTFEEIARTLDYLGLAALATAVVDRQSWSAAAAGLATGAVAVCVIAVGSRLDPSLFGQDHVDAVLHIDRLSRPFGYWNGVAAWGAMCTAIGLAWSAHDPARWRRGLALASVPLAVATTYLTYSRAGVGGTALAVVAVVALSRNRITAAVHAAIAAACSAVVLLVIRGAPEIAHRTGTAAAGRVAGVLVLAGLACGAGAWLTGRAGADRRRVGKRFSRVALACALLAIVVAGVAVGPSAARHAWHSFERLPAASTETNTTERLTSLSGTRYQVWRAALHAFEAHPLDGLGAGTFGFWWNAHATDSESVLDVHDIWLQNLAELGVPGLVAILLVVVGAVWLAVAARRRVGAGAATAAVVASASAFIVYLLHASVDWMWESTAVTVLALAGIAVAGGALGGGRVRLRFGARALIAVVAAVAALAQLPGIVSTDAIRDSQSAARAGDYTQALADASSAVSAEPWSASALQQEGLVLESTRRLHEAAVDLRRAIAREPLNYEHWFILARIETESGHIAAALGDYRRARSLAPRAEVFAVGG